MPVVSERFQPVQQPPRVLHFSKALLVASVYSRSADSSHSALYICVDACCAGSSSAGTRPPSTRTKARPSYEHRLPAKITSTATTSYRVPHGHVGFESTHYRGEAQHRLRQRDRRIFSQNASVKPMDSTSTHGRKSLFLRAAHGATYTAWRSDLIWHRHYHCDDNRTSSLPYYLNCPDAHAAQCHSLCDFSQPGAVMPR